MRDETQQIFGMALAAGFWFCALWLAAVAHGEEVCGPAGCVDIVSAGCYKEQGSDECATGLVLCEEHLSFAQLREKYGAVVGNMCGFERADELLISFLEDREERLEKRIRRLRSRLRSCR